MSILIKSVQLNNRIVDIAIDKNRISRIAPSVDGVFDTVIDGSGKLALPPFYNTHGHAAMTLFRGIADNLELFDWLFNHIWPAEENLTEESVYWGSKLAILEMIKTGTVFFNDMYFYPQATIRAAEEMRIRAAVGMISADRVSPEKQKVYHEHNQMIWDMKKDFSDRIQLAFSPHAIYTVREDTLLAQAERSAAERIPIHIHLAETRKEVEDCKAEHNGLSPVQYLDKLGVLTDQTLCAHSIHLSDEDIEILAERKSILSYNPCSNYKLSSGRFRFRKAIDSGCRVTFGTDGCASNDSLSMFDEMKFGAFAARNEQQTPSPCSAAEIFTCATKNGAQAFGIDAGVLEEGKLADIMLIDLDNTMMVADHDYISNIVYSADSSCVDTVICDGNILMQHRIVPGEKEIVRKARETAKTLVNR
ncbi:MAG: amidohydrolase [Lentisphaeria bacterium]|nr:amidohydrolase [Lentisphaeria bacterium]